MSAFAAFDEIRIGDVVQPTGAGRRSLIGRTFVVTGKESYNQKLVLEDRADERRPLYCEPYEHFYVTARYPQPGDPLTLYGRSWIVQVVADEVIGLRDPASSEEKTLQVAWESPTRDDLRFMVDGRPVAPRYVPKKPLLGAGEAVAPIVVGLPPGETHTASGGNRAARAEIPSVEQLQEALFLSDPEVIAYLNEQADGRGLMRLSFELRAIQLARQSHAPEAGWWKAAGERAVRMHGILTLP